MKTKLLNLFSPIFIYSPWMVCSRLKAHGSFILQFQTISYYNFKWK